MGINRLLLVWDSKEFNEMKRAKRAHEKKINNKIPWTQFIKEAILK